MTIPTWTPKYAITPTIASGLMRIETARVLVDYTSLTPAAEAELRHEARIKAAHYSTLMMGNRLTLEEARRVIADEQAEVAGPGERCLRGAQLPQRPLEHGRVGGDEPASH